MKRTLATLLGSILLVAACGGGEETKKADDTNVAEQPLGHDGHAQPSQPGKADLTESRCMGNKVPPTNYIQTTVFVARDTPNAVEVAKQKALTELRDRICQGYRCSAIEPALVPWHHESDEAQVCAMAVVKGSDVEKFRELPRQEFDAALAETGRKLVAAAGGKAPNIGIDNIRDVGADGGPRAEWMVDRIQTALSNAGARIAKLPADWSGLEPPKGVDAVVRGRITPMHGQESMLEVTWTLDLGKTMTAVDPIVFPELIGPKVDPATIVADIQGASDPELALRFDTRPGGGLCPGQQTEIRLEAGAPLHVRVVNLFGKGDEGILFHASPGVLKPREPVSLGEFAVVPTTDVPMETFIAFGAKQPAGLEKFEAVAAVPCRLPSGVAKQLSSGRGIPKGAQGFATNRRYRIVDDPDCSQYTVPQMEEGWLDKYPLCF